MLTLILYLIVGCAVVWTILLLVAGYNVPPYGIQDRFRAGILLGVAKMARVTPYRIVEMLGYGTFFDHILFTQRLTDIEIDKPPRSSSYEALKVTREVLDDVMVLIYRPRDAADRELLPCLVYIHGGGWCLDNPITFDHLVSTIANLTRKVTISVHYRRAPQHPFPAGFQDCVSVVRHVLQHGKTLGIDVSRVGIGGDSAGGNIAASVALHLREGENPHLPRLKYQLLVQPIVQALDFRLPSDLENYKVNPSMNPYLLAGFWALYMGLDPKETDKYAAIMERNRHVPPELFHTFSEYLDTQNLPEKFRKSRRSMARNKGSEAGDENTPCDKELYTEIKDKITNPLLSPLFAKDLRGLPPTMIVVAEFDSLRDQGLLYAHRLKRAGVRTQVHIGRGFHGDVFCCFLPDWVGLNSKSGEHVMDSLRPFLQQEQ